ncbi:recombinase family protein [Methanoregula sp.]|uniref:recombinase family protein n=1 Tax=Methanoregula sp. TaxID=2052170 RepID=UPI002C3379DC|nr:recombinase family protein [Methanoregula sp.]HVP96686.1 recombinase family protein [Methanoregula sp.]
MIKIGYVRVSREDQNAENQIKVLLDEGLIRDHIFVDHISGISDMQNREGFSQMIQFIKTHTGEPITLYVFEISRLGRSFLDTLSMVRTLEESGTRVWSLSPAESWSRIEDKKLRDLMLSIFSWVADRERENLIERTKLGIARAKADGVKLGRPIRSIPWKRVQELQEKNISLAAISRILDIPYTTLYRHDSQRKSIEKS